MYPSPYSYTALSFGMKLSIILFQSSLRCYSSLLFVPLAQRAAPTGYQCSGLVYDEVDRCDSNDLAPLGK